MRTIRYGGFCFVLFAAGLYGSDAEYLGGTVKSIPVNTVGTLDLSDSRSLLFRYGRAVYKLAFEDIKSFEISHSNSVRRVLGHVPVPHSPWRKQDAIVNLSFRSEEMPTGTLSFKIASNDLTTTEWTLKSRIEDPNHNSLVADRAKLPESWWGDRYWRTTRNSAGWPSIDAESAGTK